MPEEKDMITVMQDISELKVKQNFNEKTLDKHGNYLNKLDKQNTSLQKVIHSLDKTIDALKINLVNFTANTTEAFKEIGEVISEGATERKWLFRILVGTFCIYMISNAIQSWVG